MDTQPDGHMDAESQQKTYDGFIRFISRAAITCVGILIILALFNA